MPPTLVDAASDDRRNGRPLLELCCKGRYLVLMLASKNLIFSLIASCLPQLSYLESCLARIQYLPAQEKNQIQDFRNWMESSPEASTQSTPDSPVIGLIENSTTLSPNVDMPEASKEPPLEASVSTPPVAGEGTSNAAGCGSDKAEGSKNPTVRLVPFQSMPQSTQEELGKELFDDPLLSVDNMKKLTDSMQWCFKYTKVSLLLLLLAYVE